MKKMWFWVMLCSLVLALGAFACGGDDDDSVDNDADPDAGSDAGCADVPEACEDIGDSAAQFYGCCFDDVVYFCDDGVTLDSIDCAAGGKTCGYNAGGDYMDCI